MKISLHNAYAPTEENIHLIRQARDLFAALRDGMPAGDTAREMYAGITSKYQSWLDDAHAHLYYDTVGQEKVRQ